MTEISGPYEIVLSPSQDRVYKIVVPDVVKISPETINDDLAKHSSLVLHFNILAADLKAKRDKLADDLASAKAVVDAEVRAMAEATGQKTTEAKVASQIELSPKYQSCKRVLADAEKELAYANAIKDAFYHRKDMLVTLGAQMRAELDAELKINKKEASNGRS